MSSYDPILNVKDLQTKVRLWNTINLLLNGWQCLEHNQYNCQEHTNNYPTEFVFDNEKIKMKITIDVERITDRSGRI
jgi:hypothetical protein